MPNSNTAEKHAIAKWSEIDTSACNESCMIMWKIQRKHDDAADDYGANARLLEFDIHFQKSKFGTINEFPGA